MKTDFYGGNFKFLSPTLPTDSEVEIISIDAGNVITTKFIEKIEPYKSHIRTNLIPFVCCIRNYTFDDSLKVLRFYPVFKKDTNVELNLKPGDMLKYKIVKQGRNY